MSPWHAAQLSSVAAVFNGKTPSTTEQRELGHPVLKIRDVDALGIFRGPFKSFVEPRVARMYEDKKVRNGDVLILNAAHNADYVASKTYRASGPSIGALATGEWLVVRPDGEALDAAFTHHWVNSQSTRQALRQLVNGIHLYPKDVSRLTIPLPPLVEQRRIAEVLDRGETLRAQRRQALTQLDTLAESIYLSLLNEPASESWTRTTIGEIATAMRTGPFGSQLLHSEFVESGIAVLGIDNVVQNKFVWARPRYITESKLAQLERYRVQAGDVLITIMGTCGRCAIVPDDVPIAINTKHLCCVRLDQSRCLPTYLQATLLKHPEVLYRLGVHERGAVMPGLNMQLIRDLEMPLPPLVVQRRFEAAMKSISVQRQAMTESLDKLNALFASLQHRAFRGEL